MVRHAPTSVICRRLNGGAAAMPNADAVRANPASITAILRTSSNHRPWCQGDRARGALARPLCRGVLIFFFPSDTYVPSMIPTV